MDKPQGQTIKMNKQSFTSSAIWKIVEAFSTKGISLIISIILARILLPEDYGIVTLTAIFINLSTILVQSGLGTGLIRQDHVDDIDYNNVFFIGIGVAALCYTAFFLAAPTIASFYKEPLLALVLRVQMLSLYLVAFANIQIVIVTREFRFRELCLANILSNTISGVTGVVLAYSGFGVWSLVIYTLLRDGISSLVLFIRIKWYPSIKIDFFRMKKLFYFSIWVLIAGIIDFIGNNYLSTMMGKRYSLSELGLYGKGNQIPEMICLYTFGAISSVLLPALSAFQNDLKKLKSVCKRLVEMSSYILFPMMVGLSMISDKLVPFLFTEKWSGCIPIFIFACVTFGVNPLRVINMQLIYALGDSKKGLIIESLRAILLVIGGTLCAFVLKTSIYGIAGLASLVAIINVFITQFIAKKYIDYGFFEWIKDMLPAIILSFVMAVSVYFTGFIPMTKYLLMFIQIVVGGTVYIVISALSKNSSFYEIKTLLMNKLIRWNKQER